MRMSSPLVASHSLTFLSKPPERRRAPSGENATAWMSLSECHSKVRISCPLTASHSLGPGHCRRPVVRKRRVPSGDTAAAFQPASSLPNVRITCPLSASHSVRPFSPPAATRCESSDDKATEYGGQFPSRPKVRLSCPLSAPHNSSAWALPATRRLPSCETATVAIQGKPRTTVWISCPLAASHSRTVLSSLAESTREPSGENATEV